MLRSNRLLAAALRFRGVQLEMCRSTMLASARPGRLRQMAAAEIWLPLQFQRSLQFVAEEVFDVV